MVVSLRKKRIQLLPVRIVVWAVIALIGGALALHHNPMRLDAGLERSSGTELTDDAEADVLVVLDYEAIRQSGSTFGERDFSAAWIDLLESEIGPVSVATPETLTEAMIEGSRVLIATRSVSQSMPEAFLERLRDHALDGHTVLVDQPQGRAREVFSADGEAGHRRGQSITYAHRLPDPFDSQLQEMPLFVDYIGSTAAREDAQTLLSIDGAPVVYGVPFGRGHVITVDFDLSRQIVALQQGRPADDFSVGSTQGESPQPVRTAALIADDSLRGADVPYADLLIRFMVYGVVVSHSAIPTLWQYPDGLNGAVIFAHEDGELGDGGAWKLDYERRHGGSSTLLTTYDSGLTAAGAEKIRDQSGHIGLSWRPPHPNVARYQRLGIGPFEPFLQPIPLSSQRSALRETLGGGAVGTSRTLEGIWSDHWSAPLEALAEAGIRSDLSYESSSTRGFSFGTGLPFRALNDEGMPLAIREYPVVVSPDATEGPSIESLLAASSGGHHQLLTIVTRPSHFADYPDMDRFEQWLQVFEHVEDHDHALLNVLEFAQYQYTRRATSMRSRLETRAPLPDDLRTPDTGPTHDATLLRLTVQASRRDMDLLLPTQIGDATFVDALAGTERVGAEIVTNRLDVEQASVVGFPLLRIRLDPGFNNLEFYYQ